MPPAWRSACAVPSRRRHLPGRKWKCPPAAIFDPTMNQFLRSAIRALAGYTPGEQPQGDGIIKLNTNENPYPPSPRVLAALQEALAGGDKLRKYPDPSG